MIYARQRNPPHGDHRTVKRLRVYFYGQTTLHVKGSLPSFPPQKREANAARGDTRQAGGDNKQGELKGMIAGSRKKIATAHEISDAFNTPIQKVQCTCVLLWGVTRKSRGEGRVERGAQERHLSTAMSVILTSLFSSLDLTGIIDSNAFGHLKGA